MELAEFISTSLAGIAECVRRANRDVKAAGDTDNAFSMEPSGGDSKDASVAFDIAVTASRSDSAGGKAGVQVLGIGSGALHGFFRRSEERVSRIQFKVDINRYLG